MPLFEISIVVFDVQVGGAKNDRAYDISCYCSLFKYRGVQNVNSFPTNGKFDCCFLFQLTVDGRRGDLGLSVVALEERYLREK